MRRRLLLVVLVAAGPESDDLVFVQHSNLGVCRPFAEIRDIQVTSLTSLPLQKTAAETFRLNSKGSLL